MRGGFMIRKWEATYNMYDFLQKLERESDKMALTAIHERLMRGGYKIQAKHKGAGFDIKYSIKSRKPIVQILYKKDKYSGFEIHLRPLHIEHYSNRLSELSEHIRNCCIQGKDCGKCGYCDKAYVYEYEGITYVKCQFICFNFRFINIDICDIDSVIRVLDMELEQISDKK
jgi:hypothetical protein